MNSTRTSPLRHRIAIGLLTVAWAAGCGSSQESAPPTWSGPAPIPTVTITIEHQNYSGTPPITPGAVLTVVNHDSVKHSITSKRPGLFDREIGPGQSITFTAPDEVGSHPFYCRYHANMDGALSVRRSISP
ncbi:cupredoxin domain-containing protein [Nocardia sp. NPDC050630]|uniref:cupredoxin domain-containing protein n=1 Tax=Nocardia sp. NPDC050630 TaxID=3364321 RepID=UPI0037AF63D6